MSFSESCLIEEFILNLPTSPFSSDGDIKFATEFDYTRGRADIIIFQSSGEIIAIEAKLEKWREALHQAYRNTCFAHYSYILVPEVIAEKAIRYDLEFQKRNVGICYLSKNSIIIAKPADKNIPIQEWLSERAINTILKEDNADARIYQSVECCTGNM